MTSLSIIFQWDICCFVRRGNMSQSLSSSMNNMILKKEEEEDERGNEKNDDSISGD